MKTTTALFGATLTMLLAAGPGLAQTGKTTSEGTMKESRTMSAPAEKPGMLAMPHRVTGEVVAADPSASTLTVRDSKGKEYTFKADTEAAARLNAVTITPGLPPL
jgi:hypothetical protein